MAKIKQGHDFYEDENVVIKWKWKKDPVKNNFVILSVRYKKGLFWFEQIFFKSNTIEVLKDPNTHIKHFRKITEKTGLILQIDGPEWFKATCLLIAVRHLWKRKECAYVAIDSNKMDAVIVHSSHTNNRYENGIGITTK